MAAALRSRAKALRFGFSRLYEGEGFGKAIAGQGFDCLEELFFEGRRVCLAFYLWGITILF